MAYVVCMILNQSLCQTCCDICWCKELNFYIHALKEFIKQMSKGRSVRGCWQQSKTQSANENTASQGMAGFYSTFTDKTESFCWGWAIWGATSSREKKMHLENHYPEQILAVSMLFQAGGVLDLHGCIGCHRRESSVVTFLLRYIASILKVITFCSSPPGQA